MRSIAAISGVATILLSAILVCVGIAAPTQSHARFYNAIVLLFDLSFILSVIPGTIHAFKNKVVLFEILFPLLLLFCVGSFVVSMTVFCIPFKIYLVFDCVVLLSYILFFLTQFRK